MFCRQDFETWIIKKKQVLGFEVDISLVILGSDFINSNMITFQHYKPNPKKGNEKRQQIDRGANFNKIHLFSKQ